MTPTIHGSGKRGRAARGVLALAALACVMAGSVVAPDRPARYRQEGQPAADLGNGLYRNPILAGDYPDPSVVRVGADYYMTHSSGTATPGLLVWHSRDLVNWEPLGYALKDFAGDVWAPDIVHYQGLFYIYFPAAVAEAGGRSRQTCFVIAARSASGPWSEPIDLHVGGIDPGHAVAEAGNRWLYVDGGRVVRLSRDGLRTEGELRKVYDGWIYPADWNVECMCLESPKIAARDGFYYLVSAEGWPRLPAGLASSGDLPKPAGESIGRGLSLSDDFRGPGLGLQWRRWDGADGAAAADRYAAAAGELRMKAKGAAVAALLTLLPADHSYEVEVAVAVPPAAEGGLLLRYDAARFAGAALRRGHILSYLRSRPDGRTAWPAGRVFLKLRNIRHDVAAFYSADGRTWTKFETGFDMSGFHHATFGGWSTLRVALFAAGEGTVVFRNFRYRGLM